ncbi:MAG: hypothetical protein QXL94_01170 [Candidatus Parvarchaeum sp.]
MEVDESAYSLLTGIVSGKAINARIDYSGSHSTFKVIQPWKVSKEGIEAEDFSDFPIEGTRFELIRGETYKAIRYGVMQLYSAMLHDKVVEVVGHFGKEDPRMYFYFIGRVESIDNEEIVIYDGDEPYSDEYSSSLLYIPYENSDYEVKEIEERKQKEEKGKDFN